MSCRQLDNNRLHAWNSVLAEGVSRTTETRSVVVEKTYFSYPLETIWGFPVVINDS